MADYKAIREVEARLRAIGGHQCEQPSGCMDCEESAFRILVLPDETASLEELKGDCFNPEVNADLDPAQLREEERAFEESVEAFGVWGMVLEARSGPERNAWSHVDSCWGFCDVEALEAFKAELVARAETLAEPTPSAWEAI